MKASTKFLIGGAMVLSTSGYLMASSIKDTAQYYMTPTELATKVKSDSKFLDRGVKVGARVVSGTIQRDPSGRQLSFQMTDGAQTYAVDYRGIAPDTFTDGVDVVVEGKLDAAGTFHAKTLLAKCASRYENAPEQDQKYKQTPGYQNRDVPGTPTVPAAPPAVRGE